MAGNKLNKQEKNQIKRFKEIDQEIHTLGGIAALLGWDKQTIIPSKAHSDRAEQSSYLSSKIHELMVSSELKKLVTSLTKETTLEKLSKREQTLLLYFKKEIKKSSKIPNEFVKEFSKLSSQSYSHWVSAREKNEFKLFAPYLQKMIQMKKKEASLINKKKPAYDVIVDEFEEGMTQKKIDPVFKELREGIIEILTKIKQTKKYKTQKIPFKNITFPNKEQLKISSETVQLILQDKSRYHVAESVHPFTTRISFDDVRLTTAVRKDHPLFSFTGAAHEAGHALYELGMDSKLKHTALRDAPSFGLHESQSRLWENQIMRGFDYWKYFYPKYQKTFPELKKLGFKDFFSAMNQVKPSLIRIECDELTYCMHIIIRYELEKEIFAGKIKAKDLKKAWNTKYKEYLGVTPKKDVDGILQDVHWAEGYFGYFPTYAIGTLYSAMLFEQMLKDLPNLKKELQAGKVDSVRDWLRNHVHKFGREMSSEEIVYKATGKKLTAKPFLGYLKQKYYSLYGLK